ncbi:hypothetical protein RHEph01_gp057 [Rhizobium phage RHEph01]|uniref:Uncharacterized protein n=1 Tax=Rhizobium phage RHEph01 TaxID=1220601 RepID=L7TLR3_9CAUD|nr:hypothetical protein HOQ88_gp01 [Rhizobium phage RHEph01]YP_009783958.1 hypothetical protein HOQ88_gp37 [Rhizobium phage RHEph01]AGC35512.1 hypothetical protein RHEph01_gp001 [Rhizobium phage RHEph01]AGC35567.1 hypothetical protein RHEph01_gp057 [Rhizobium phage RHEph01]
MGHIRVAKRSNKPFSEAENIRECRLRCEFPFPDVDEIVRSVIPFINEHIFPFDHVTLSYATYRIVKKGAVAIHAAFKNLGVN